MKRKRLRDEPPVSGPPVPASNGPKWTMKAIRKWAFESGELPHVFLLRVSRGEEVDGYKPTFADRVDAAKNVAQYFAPKLAAMAVSEITPPPEQTENTFKLDAQKLGELSDAELNLLEKILIRFDGDKGADQGRTTYQADPKEYQKTIDG